MGAVIRLSGITYRYPTSDWILKGIDLDIGTDDYLVVMGGNGSGKSTLGYLINGLIPDFFCGTLQGSVKRDHLPSLPANSVPMLGLSGLVLQNTDAQLFHSTVSDEIAFGLENIGLSAAEIDHRIHDMAARLGLEHLLARAPWQLSGGEKRLAAIAAVLSLNPALLILDEPFANLDRQSRSRVQQSLREIHQSGTAVVVIEQRLGPFLQDATRCCVLKQGQVVFDGQPTQALTVLAHEHLQPRYPKRAAVRVPAGDILLKARDLCYRIGQREILSNVSLEIRSGETVAIVGKNGAGKTTLIKHFNGLLRPTSGDLLFQGQAIGDQVPAAMAAKVGLSFQNPNDQFFKSRVEDELLVGLQHTGNADADWLEKICTVFNLRAFMERAPYRLSEGEKKRVALCATFSMLPDLVVLDEPTAGQDGRFRETLAEFLALLEDLGFTILIVTHDLDFARATTDRWIVLDKGQVIADGPPHEIYDDPPLVDIGIFGRRVSPLTRRRQASELTPSPSPPTQPLLEDDRTQRPHDQFNDVSTVVTTAVYARWLNRDPRTKLLLGLMAMAAILMARHPSTIVAQSILVMAALVLGRLMIPWLRSLRLMLPMLALVAAVSTIAYDFKVAGLLTLRLCSLYTLSLILFRTISPAEMSAALQKMSLPYEFSFMLTTALHYVPLMGQKIRHIMDAQQSRGIDLRLRLKNAKNFMALLAPLLIQSFILADELAMAMELRGFGRKTRTIRQQYRLKAGDYLLLAAGFILLITLLGWERW